MKTFYREFALLINIIYWLPMFMSMAVAIVVAWFVGSHFKIKKAYKTIISLLAACAVSLFWIIPVEKAERQRIAKYNERKEKYQVAKAVFDKQCEKAGEKIYRTVDNVDGIMLLKVRGDSEKIQEDTKQYGWSADPMWERAAIANIESANHNYVRSFLKFDDNEKEYYYFVDVLNEDNSISRYWYNNKDEEIKNINNPARYAVTYENNIDPELRKHWVAGVTIKIIDRQTDELLAEKTIFTFEPGLGSTATGRMPWLHHPEHCPELLERWEDKNPTSKFTIQVLKSQPLNSQE